MQENKKSNAGIIAGIIGGAVAITAIVVLILVLTLGGGSKGIVGTWKVVSATEKGQTITGEQLKTTGLDGYKMTFESDGTCSVIKNGKEGASSCKYEDGKIYDDNEEAGAYELDGDKLTIIISEDASMTLERE